MGMEALVTADDRDCARLSDEVCDTSPRSPVRAGPVGWVELAAFRKEAAQGFRARLYGKEGRFIVALRGTGNPRDWDTDVSGAVGLYSSQVAEALKLVAEMQVAGIPMCRTCFTGRSLGGGLAAVMAVFFARGAVVFAAPCERPAIDVPFLLTVTDFCQHSIACYYEGYMTHLSTLGPVPPDAGFLAYRNAWQQGRTAGRDLFQAREGLVREICTDRARQGAAGQPAGANRLRRNVVRLAALLTASLPEPRSDVALH